MGFIDTVRKAFGGPGAPDVIADALAAQGMTSTTSLGPGTPLAPADGFSRTPRSIDYRSGTNISARPRTNEKISFDTLRSLIDAYDVAQMCITHRIDSVRSMAWKLQPAEGVDDATDAIARARAFLKRPDGELYFRAWLSKYLYDVLAFDAGTLYKIRNNAGQSIGLRVIDGTTIAPILDGWGNRPDDDAPAYVQFVQGTAWNWLTENDLIYQPYRPISNTPYGRAPLESILLNANTDLRFQQYFLQRFTAGNIPEGFAVSPNSWTPDQIQAFQETWDALLAGDQEAKHQVRWVPGGTSFEFPNKEEFSEEFSLFLMRKTAAAYHVTPADLGFTDDVNKSTGTTQLSVQSRVGDLPLMQHVEDILTAFLQDDMGLPVEFRFDSGGEAADRLATAQADKIYMDSGVISPSHILESRYGKTEEDGQTVPRYMLTSAGPVPLSTLFAASTLVNPETAGPMPGIITPAAQLAITAVGAPVGGPPAATPVALVKAVGDELGVFRRFVKARYRAGVWRDFTFDALDPVNAHRLNRAANAELRKAGGELIAAGLAVRAADTGRVLMLQRALDPTDDAAGMWEFPGGHIEPGETITEAAFREWTEEVGMPAPHGLIIGDWLAGNGVYAGYVLEVADEGCVPPRSGHGTLNPDDPDGDNVETIAWFDPADLIGNSMVRRELAGDLRLVLQALAGGTARVTDPAGADTESAPVVAPEAGSVAASTESVATAEQEDDAAPLAKGWRDTTRKAPQQDYDLVITDHYAPLIDAALTRWVDSLGIDKVIEQATPAALVKAEGDEPNIDEPDPARIRAALLEGDPQAIADLEALLEQLGADGYESGAHAAGQQLNALEVRAEGFGQSAASTVDWDAWKPGDPAAALRAADGGMRTLLDQAGLTVKGLTDSKLDQIGNLIAAGIKDGDPSAKIARDIRSRVGNRAQAERIAHTEATRAVIAGTFDTYQQSGVEEWELLTSDGACDRCLAIAAAGPHPVSNMKDTPPVHPFCRCASTPVVDSVEGGRIKPSPNKPTPPNAPPLVMPATVTEAGAAPALAPVAPQQTVRVISTLKDMDAFGALMPAPSSLGERAAKVVDDYAKGSAYSANAVLRGQSKVLGRTIDARSKKAAKEFTKNMDAVMDASVIPEAVRVVRTVDMSAFGGVDGLKGLTGTVYQDKGYTSTSLAAKTDSKVYQGGSDAVSMTITVPPGTKAVYMAGESYLRSERELLLDRGSRFAIESATYNEKAKKWEVTATVIPGDRP